MDLSLKERILLANQYRLLAKLDPDVAALYQRNEEILRNGYRDHYKALEDTFSDELSAERTNWVNDIVTMYDEIWTGFQALNPEDQTEIGASNIRFEGFHGNSESDLLCYAKFRMRRLWGTLFQNLWDGERSLDTHLPAREAYDRMLATYRQIERPKYRPLTKDEIVRLLEDKPISLNA
jgi:uncharacterized protein YfbU (UPF0304 family)